MLMPEQESQTWLYGSNLGRRTWHFRWKRIGWSCTLTDLTFMLKRTSSRDVTKHMTAYSFADPTHERD